MLKIRKIEAPVGGRKITAGHIDFGADASAFPKKGVSRKRRFPKQRSWKEEVLFLDKKKRPSHCRSRKNNSAPKAK